MPPRFWLPAKMSNNFARPVRSWGYHFNARVGVNCCWWVCTCSTLAYFVVLQWTFRDFTLKWKKSQIFSFFLVGLRKLQETGWNWARTSSEKHQESNWVWGKKVREMVWEKKNCSGSQNSKSYRLGWISTKVLRWSENRERPSINSKCFDWS